MLTHHEAGVVPLAGAAEGPDPGAPYQGSRDVARTLVDAVERGGHPWTVVPVSALAGRDLVQERSQTWPLVLPDGEVLGVLVREAGDGDHDDLIMVLLRTFASLVSAEHAAAEAGRRVAAAEYDARIDALTGLLNRRAWDDALSAESARMRRHGRPAVLVVVDLDDLKQVNDAGGHLAGDFLIQETAAALRSAVRDEDVVARIGGDEFAVLAVESTGTDADAIRRRIRAALADADVDASVGVALVEPGGSFAESFERADREMYEAKRRGKAGGIG
jgi:diguanylate cyclase (GGDEF)-like protein